MNILISVNQNYLDKAKTMLFSIRLHTKEQITIYLLNHQLSYSEIKDFESYLNEKCKMDLHVINTTCTELDDLPIGELNFSIEMYYRIIAQFLLPNSLERILWLDADMVVLKDIAELYYQDFDNMKYIVAADSQNESRWVQEVKEKIGLPKSHLYFNSGVLLMNLQLLREETNMEYIISQSHLLKDKLTYPDQDILNYLYQKDVKYVEWKKYNCQVIGLDVTTINFDDIIILHYCGKEKPWEYWNISGISKYYWKVRVKEGFLFETFNAYWKKKKELTYEYIKSLKDVLGSM